VNVVLLHAFPLDSLMWEPQHEVLAGHEVLAPDLYGFGSSMEEWARAILPRIDGDFVVVGASMGGYCALALARLAPERVEALVLAGSRADPDTPERREGRAATIELIRRGGPEALWEDMRPKLFPDDADPAVVEAAGELALTQDPDGLVRAVEAIRDRLGSSDVVETLECPILVAGGDNDPFVPVADAEALAARARDGRIAIFRSGHLPSLERPEEFNRALLAFLNSAAEPDRDASRV
jgi:pimeloyl-ACP methyl ester carboxylesterase